MILGKSATESKPVDGIYTLAEREIEITDATGETPTKKINILRLYSLCKSAEPCLAETYVTNVSAKIDKLKFATLTKALSMF